jgi:hypothetical protein
LLSPIVSKKLQTKRPIMLEVTTEVPVPTSPPPPHKVKKAGNNFQDKSFKKIEDLLPWGFSKKF